MTLRVPTEVKERFAALAEVTARSEDALLRDALDLYPATKGREIEAIARAIVEADAGQFATEEEVEAVFNKYSRVHPL